MSGADQLDDFAEAFAAGGLAVLLHDHRGWGESDTAVGEPRHEVDPWWQIRDFQHAAATSTATGVGYRGERAALGQAAARDWVLEHLAG